MKGIILAGGSGSRLHPLTFAITKQLLPVYDKPMIYYPLAVLMQMGIHEICIISTKEDLPRFQHVLGSGLELGLSFEYIVQMKPEGIAQALVLAEDFLEGESVALILGDNIFYGHSLSLLLQKAQTEYQGAAIFGYRVKNPSRYGVIEFDEEEKPRRIIEKPSIPPSDFAVTGLYFYDREAPYYAKQLKPSKRGEYEITDLNQVYLESQKLHVTLFDDGFAWLDMGTHEALHQAASFVQTIQERQGIQIACLEEIAYKKGLITLEGLEHLSRKLGSSSYGEFIKDLLHKEKAKHSKNMTCCA